MKKVIFFPIILALVIYFIIAFVVPLFQEMQTIEIDIDQKQTVLADLRSDFESVSGSVARIKSEQVNNDFIDLMVPSGADEQEVINAISRLVAKNGANLYTISFGAEQNTNSRRVSQKKNMTSTVRTVGDIVILGTYEQLYGVARDLFRVKRLYGMEELTIGQIDVDVNEGEEGAPQNLQLTTQFIYHHLSEDKPSLSPRMLHGVTYDRIEELRAQADTVQPIAPGVAPRPNPFAP